MRLSNQERTAWLAKRKLGIGGSDIAAIIGANPYQSPLDVWRSKVLDEPDFDNGRMATGRKLERQVAIWYAEENGLPALVDETKQNGPGVYSPSELIIRDSANEKFLASCDFFYTSQKSSGVLECKTTSFSLDSVQNYHFCQGQWYLGVTGREELAIAYAHIPRNFNHEAFNKKEWSDMDVLRAVIDTRNFHFERSDSFIQYMREKAEQFWTDYVIPKRPPEPINEADVKYLYPKSSPGSVLEADDRVLTLYEKAIKAKEDLDKAKKEYENLTGQFKAIFHDKEAAVYNGRTLATYKNDKDGETFDKDAFRKGYPDIYRQFVKPSSGSRRFILK